MRYDFKRSSGNASPLPTWVTGFEALLTGLETNLHYHYSQVHPAAISPS